MSPEQSRIEEAEAWAALLTRLIAFLFGMVLLFLVAIPLKGDDSLVRLGLAVAGVSCMGPVIAASAASIVSAWRSQ